MALIATLGPANTFSELAAQLYNNEVGGLYSIKLYPTLSKAFAAISTECECGLFPIENMTEGYVSIVLDMLVHSEASIVHEMLLPIQFSLVANSREVEEIEKVYVQFVTQGQCEKFIDGLGETAVITTQSNGMSLEQVRKAVANEAAIVPAYSVRQGDFDLVVENIADYSNNQTRFIVLQKNPAEHDSSKSYKTSLLIFEGADKPGVLSNILTAFSSRGINLVSIMSRPTKEMLGRYHFFVDIEGYHLEDHIQEALAEIGVENTIKLLGSYPKAVGPIDFERDMFRKKRPSKRAVDAVAGLSASPFEFDASYPAVFWASGDGPYDNTRKALSNIDLSPAKNKRVLLKPNVGRDVEPETGVTTHPQVVAAAIDAFREAGAEMAVGESPISGVVMFDAFENSGITAVARERNCPLIDMDARRYIPLNIPDGAAIKTLKVCREVLEYDIVVSIPVMKTHMHTSVTLSVKNMKGCLWRRSKVDFHMLGQLSGRQEKPLDIAIVDMASVLHPSLSIIDGTIGMEGLGPSAGKAKVLGVVLVGVDAFATDSVACELMGISACDVSHLCMGAERGYGVIDLDKISISPGNWKEVRSPFALPPEKLSIEFSGFTILDEQSCSACQSTLFMFLKRHGKELRDSVSDEEDIVIAIGKGHKKLPGGSLCVGNCTIRHKDIGKFVSGCPPVASEILNEYFAS